MTAEPSTHGVATLGKALDLLERIAADPEPTTAAHVLALGIAPATGRRLVRALEMRGLLQKIGHGRHMAGPRLATLGLAASAREALQRLARPRLEQLAEQFQVSAHLGLLEAEMVTYVVKAERGAGLAFTREGEQLEAYCSGIGKALLAEMAEDSREAYLASGPFVALTPNTITSAPLLRLELETIRARGYAIDDEEVAAGLYCVAVPLRLGAGPAHLALSLAGATARLAGARRSRAVEGLRGCAARLLQRWPPDLVVDASGPRWRNTPAQAPS